MDKGVDKLKRTRLTDDIKSEIARDMIKYEAKYKNIVATTKHFNAKYTEQYPNGIDRMKIKRIHIRFHMKIEMLDFMSFMTLIDLVRFSFFRVSTVIFSF